MSYLLLYLDVFNVSVSYITFPRACCTPFLSPCGRISLLIHVWPFASFVVSLLFASFVASLLPLASRRSRYATFAALAGVDATDERAAAAGLPAVDSLNLWPYLSGQAGSSPRTEIHLSQDSYISGRYKLLVGTSVSKSACWGGPFYPNSSTATGPHKGPFGGPCTSAIDCTSRGCLFDVVDDSSEYHDLAADAVHNATIASVIAKLGNKLELANQELFRPKRGGWDHRACEAAGRNGWYWGPFLP
jgi:arylsulfatase I/J